MRRLWLCLAAALVLGLARDASSEDGAHVRVRGPGAGSIERAVGRVLGSHGYRVVGRRKPAVLRVEGRVRGKRRVTVSLTVRRGAQEIASLRLSAASSRAAARRVESELWPAILAALAPPPETPEAPEEPAIVAAPEPTPPAPRESPAPVSSAAEVSASAPEPPAGATPWLRIAAGPELYGRHFSYRDDIFGELQEYDVTATPAVSATADVYPMIGRRGALAGLGLAGRFTHVPSFDSEDGAGARYRSEARAYAVGARYRYRLAMIELAGALDYGAQSFSIAAVGDAMEPDFPAVDYRYLRAGASAAAPIWSRYSISVAAGYRQVLDSGEIAGDDFFPRSSARGLDVELALHAALMWGFDLRAGAALERYGHDLQPVPGDDRVAGGALDQYPRLYVRLGFSR